jgi:RNA polymerase primary sigma factor
VEVERRTARGRRARRRLRQTPPAKLPEQAWPRSSDGRTSEDSERLRRLVTRAQRGEPAAREQLIEHLLPLIESLARAHHVDGLEHQDLVQEGCVGLLRALARYDPSRGVPFPAYALWWIRQALQEARSDFLRPFRLPPKALRQLAQLKSAHHRIYASERRQPGNRELADATAIPLDQVESLLAANPPTRSLDEPVAGTENEIGTLGELLADPLSVDAYEDVLHNLAGQQMRTLLGTLTERERDVVNARFGFDRPAETLAQIGEQRGISAERVRQIEGQALAKLRQSSGAPTVRPHTPGAAPTDREGEADEAHTRSPLQHRAAHAPTPDRGTGRSRRS